MKNTKIILLVLCLLSLCISIASFAEEPAKEAKANAPAAPAAAAVPAKDVDISDLEDSYWRPNKDELEVVQNRRFDKTGKFELNLGYGFYQGSDYVNTRTVGAGLAYNWNNTWFTEISYMKMYNTDNTFLSQVRTQYGFTPDFNREVQQYEIAMGWTPIYAKFSFLGKEISHFETYIAPGIGLTQTAANHFTANLSVGEKFFVSEHLIIRLEWKMSRYTDQINATQGTYAKQNGGTGFFQQQETKHNIIFSLGWMF